MKERTEHIPNQQSHVLPSPDSDYAWKMFYVWKTKDGKFYWFPHNARLLRWECSLNFQMTIANCKRRMKAIVRTTSSEWNFPGHMWTAIWTLKIFLLFSLPSRKINFWCFSSFYSNVSRTSIFRNYKIWAEIHQHNALQDLSEMTVSITILLKPWWRCFMSWVTETGDRSEYCWVWLYRHQETLTIAASLT